MHLIQSDKHFQHVSCVYVYYFIVWKYFFFLIDCLDSPSKLFCYSDFLVEYRDKLIFVQMSASDEFQAPFQLTAFDF